MTLAILETANFTFHVVAETQTAAREALTAAWDQHRRHSGAGYGWDDVEDGVWYIPVTLGTVYRDGTAMQVQS